jgi:hypothetical protein
MKTNLNEAIRETTSHREQSENSVMAFEDHIKEYQDGKIQKMDDEDEGVD